MNRPADMGLALTLSILFHAGVFLALGRFGFLAVTAGPLFKLGQSSVALTFVPYQPPVPTQDPVKSPSVLVLEPPVEAVPEPEPLPPADADAAEKGVEVLAAENVALRPVYPLSARLRNEQGDVRLRARIDPRGRVRRVEVVRSCGFPALDRSASEALYQAAFPPVDPTGPERVIELTFRFRLVED